MANNAALERRVAELERQLGKLRGPAGGPVWAQGLTFVEQEGCKAWDFDQDDLVVDSSWHRIDLSSLVPDPSAKLIHIRWRTRDDAVGKMFALKRVPRPNELDTGYAIAEAHVHVVAGQYAYGSWLIACDDDRHVLYYATTGFDSIAFLVRGWWRSVYA